jgi:hypothetical protein
MEKSEKILQNYDNFYHLNFPKRNDFGFLECCICFVEKWKFHNRYTMQIKIILHSCLFIVSDKVGDLWFICKKYV